MASSTLTPGQSLTENQTIVSPSGGFTLIMQDDGNLVLYKGNPDPVSGDHIWSTDSSGSGATYAIMQVDGNFVLYNAVQKDVWSSKTYNNPGAWLELQDTGDLVIHGYIWQTNTGDNS